MSSYRVVTSFMAFQREYKRDEILTDGELACWEPEELRAETVLSLTRQGKIEPLVASAPEAKYPATFGTVRAGG